MNQEICKGRDWFSVNKFRFESESFSGADEARRVAEEFVNQATRPVVRGLKIGHEKDHALADSSMVEGRAQGRFILSGLSFRFPHGWHLVVAISEYEPIGERTRDERRRMLRAPKTLSLMDRIELLKLKLWS